MPVQQRFEMVLQVSNHLQHLDLSFVRLKCTLSQGVVLAHVVAAAADFLQS